MSINSVKISQIVLGGVLYDVNVSYKDASGDLFPIENPSNFSLFSEDQSKKLHEFIRQSIAQIPQSKSLSSYSSIKIDDEGVFSQGNEKLVEMAETISSIWKEAKAVLISHFENSTTSVLIPLDHQAPPQEVAGRQPEDEEAVTIQMSLQRNAQSTKESTEEEQKDLSALLGAARNTGTSFLSTLGSLFTSRTDSQQALESQLNSILEEASIKEALGKEKTNEGYYKELVDAVFNLIITTRNQTLKQFIESLEEVAKELRKNESDHSIKKQISHKLSAQMIEKLKEIHQEQNHSFENLKAFSKVYRGCNELKDASPAFSETSFKNIIQAKRV
jgi:hypothetical protein